MHELCWAINIEMCGLGPKEWVWVERWNAHTQQSAQKWVWNVTSPNEQKHRELGSEGAWCGERSSEVKRPMGCANTGSLGPARSVATKPWRLWRHLLWGTDEDLDHCFHRASLSPRAELSFQSSTGVNAGLGSSKAVLWFWISLLYSKSCNLDFHVFLFKGERTWYNHKKDNQCVPIEGLYKIPDQYPAKLSRSWKQSLKDWHHHETEDDEAIKCNVIFWNRKDD